MFNPFQRFGDTVQTSLLTQLLPWLLLGLALLLAIAAAGGFWFGKHWTQGKHAIAQNASLKQEAKELLDNAKSLQANAIDTQLKFNNAASRMAAIGQETEDVNRQTREFARQQSQAVEQLLRNRPDLDAVRVGPELLCAWNRAAQGGSAATASAPGCGPKPAAAVPGAAGGARRPGAHAPSKPSAGGAAAPRVHRSARRADQGREADGSHGARLVLRRSHIHRVLRGERLYC